MNPDQFKMAAFPVGAAAMLPACLALGLCLLGLPASQAQTPALPPTAQWETIDRPHPRLPLGTRVIREIDYVGQGNDQQTLDLYLAPGSPDPSAVPLVVWVHGGGWRQGSKRNPPAVDALLQARVAVASIDYRLTDQAIYPAQIHDCKAAIRFLRKQASRLGIDGQRIGVWGASAGGHLVALLGTSGDVAELEGNLGVTDVSSRVQVVCDWFGPTDLQKMNAQAGDRGRLDHDAPDSPESRLLGGPLPTMTRQAQRASPLTYVSADDPPFLIMHGTADLLVPLAQSQALHDRLRQAGVDSRLVIVDGGGHGNWSLRYREQAVEFLVKRLHRSPQDEAPQ